MARQEIEKAFDERKIRSVDINNPEALPPPDGSGQDS